MQMQKKLSDCHRRNNKKKRGAIPMGPSGSFLFRTTPLARFGAQRRIYIVRRLFHSCPVVAVLRLVTQPSMSEIQSSKAVLAALKGLQQKVRHLEVRGGSSRENMLRFFGPCIFRALCREHVH